jgi:protein TonB
MDACTPSPIGGRIVPPVKLRDAKPEFPDTRHGTKVSALVTLAARIGVDGSVEDVQPTSSGDPDLEAAAMAAVRQWQFTPTYLNCAPVPLSMTVTVRFAPQP